VPRPARALAVSGALVVAGVLVGGTAYAAASQARPVDDTYFACINLASGAMRLIDPPAGQACNGTVGPGQEREISWSRTAGERGPQGPAGPRGPRGESGEDSDYGQPQSLEDVKGVRCKSGDETGRVEFRVQPPEQGSGIQLICMTDDTITTTPRPEPTKPSPPTTRPPRPEPTIEPTEPPTEDPDQGGEPEPDQGGEPEPDLGGNVVPLGQF
jgi:hypothetical protein